MLGKRKCCCTPAGTAGCNEACGCINLPDSLTLTDSALGLTVALSLNAVPELGSSIEWKGTASYTYPGIGACAAKTVIISYYFIDCAASAFWRTVGNPAAGGYCPETGPWAGRGTIDFGTISGNVTGSGCASFARSVTITGSATAGNSQGALYGVGVGTTLAVSGETISCCMKYIVEDCSANPLDSTTLTLWTDSTRTSAARTATTDSSGTLIFTDIPAGAYVITGEGGGLVPYVAARTIACGDTIEIRLTSDSSHKWSFTGCGSLPLQGVVLTIAGLGDFTSDANGEVNINTETGSYAWTVASSRVSGASGTESLSLCVDNTASAVLTPSSGYHCLSGCAWPVPDTLHCTYATAGAQTFTYSAGNWTSSFSFGGHSYVATLDGSTGAYSITKDGVACTSAAAFPQSCYVPGVSGFLTLLNSGTCNAALGTGNLTE